MLARVMLKDQWNLVLVFGINEIRRFRLSRRRTPQAFHSTAQIQKTKNKKTKNMKNKIKQSAFGGVLALATVLLPGSASATIINLSTPGLGPVTTPDGVVWSQTAQQPTGTGVIKPFLRMQDSNSPIEEGYNTSVAPLPMDDLGTADQWVHDVAFSSADTSSGFVKLLLDANQTGSNPLLTMSKLVVWRASIPAGNTATTLAQLTAQLGTPAYDMDASLGDSQVNLAVQNTNGFDANNGSGSGDLYVNIPASKFTGTGAYLVLYSEFGDGGNPNYVNNDGFEEWAVKLGPQGVPDGGSTLILLGSAFSGLALIASRRKKARNA